jgi:hypothetical protein
MTLPEQLSLKRRRQILDDETEDSRRFDASEYEGTWMPEDSWVKSFVARLAQLIRNISGTR